MPSSCVRDEAGGRLARVGAPHADAKGPPDCCRHRRRQRRRATEARLVPVRQQWSRANSSSDFSSNSSANLHDDSISSNAPELGQCRWSTTTDERRTTQQQQVVALSLSHLFRVQEEGLRQFLEHTHDTKARREFSGASLEKTFVCEAKWRTRAPPHAQKAVAEEALCSLVSRLDLCPLTLTRNRACWVVDQWAFKLLCLFFRSDSDFGVSFSSQLRDQCAKLKCASHLTYCNKSA